MDYNGEEISEQEWGVADIHDSEISDKIDNEDDFGVGEEDWLHFENEHFIARIR